MNGGYEVFDDNHFTNMGESKTTIAVSYPNCQKTSVINKQRIRNGECTCTYCGFTCPINLSKEKAEKKYKGYIITGALILLLFL